MTIATIGIDERTGEGSARRTTTVRTSLHDLPGGALPRDGPQGAADIAARRDRG